MRKPHRNPYLFEQFRQGNRYAFGYLFHRYVDSIYKYSWELTGSPVIAMAHSEKTFVNAYDEREGFRDEAHFRLFLFLTVRQLAQEYLREAGRMIELKAMPAPLTGEPLPAAGYPEAELVWDEMALSLRDSWLHLPATVRRIIVFYYFRQMSTVEIAQKMKMDPLTVQMHLSQSVILFRKASDGRWDEVNIWFS